MKPAKSWIKLDFYENTDTSLVQEMVVLSVRPSLLEVTKERHVTLSYTGRWNILFQEWISCVSDKNEFE